MALTIVVIQPSDDRLLRGPGEGIVDTFVINESIANVCLWMEKDIQDNDGRAFKHTVLYHYYGCNENTDLSPGTRDTWDLSPVGNSRTIWALNREDTTLVVRVNAVPVYTIKE